MKSSFTIFLILFTLSGLFAQTDSTVKIVFGMNKIMPPSYTFSTDPQTEGAKYYWSFGDNTISDSPTPTHTFKIGDTYLVQVKVTMPDGKSCTGEVKTRFEGGTATTTTNILYGRGKVVDMSVTAGCGLMIVLDKGTSLIPAEMATDFLLKAGQYVELTYELLNDKPSTCPPGIMARIQKIAEIPQIVTCRVPITFTKNETTPVSYTFTTEAQPEGSKYYWNFGDGGQSDQASPAHTYKISGTYPINLKVVGIDNKSCSGELKAVFVGETNPPLAGRGKVKKLELAGCDLAILLENGTTLIPFTIATEFILKEGQYVEFTFEKYAEKVSTCKEGTDVKILTIKEIPLTPECKASFTATNKLWSDPAMLKKMVFSNLSTGDIKECKWNFGDNTTSTELRPTHEYPAFGEYKVCLTITTVAGCTSEYCATVKVAEGGVITGCKFDLVIKPKEATPNSFLFYTFCPVEIKTWSWNFGDGKTSDAKNPEHAYEKAGIYEVSCVVTTAIECTETRTVKHTVLAAPLSACTGAISLLLFDPTNSQCNGKATIKLMDGDNEMANVKYIWPDGKTGSTVENLCADKTYTVQAIIDGVCQKSTSFTMLSKPIWRATTIDGQNKFSVVEPKEGVQYEWDFGNGMSLEGADVSYNFEKDGVYDVQLIAVSGNAVSESSQQVVVMKSVTGTDIIVRSELEIYPNPVKEMLKINLGNSVQGNLYLEIMNITGQRIYAQQLNIQGSSQTEINVQQLHSGIYFLRITNGRYLIANRKFIKID